ncbi:Putative lumazine-binding protein [bacterium YEK0313]|nr:Putative lumazine-binding protein [bacterium YEK0313]
MSYDRSTIEAVVQLYFDGLYECDADKLAEAFHPSADLRWNENGELKVLGYKDWLGLVRQRTSPKSQGHPRHDFLVTVDRSDEKTAFVKVKCALPPRFFIDYLVLMKLSDGWRVVSKSYRYEMRE